MTADWLSFVGGRQSFIFHRREAEYTEFGEKIVFTTKDTKFTKGRVYLRIMIEKRALRPLKIFRLVLKTL
jgi:hypothetical protein